MRGIRLLGPLPLFPTVSVGRKMEWGVELELEPGTLTCGHAKWCPNCFTKAIALVVFLSELRTRGGLDTEGEGCGVYD